MCLHTRRFGATIRSIFKGHTDTGKDDHNKSPDIDNKARDRSREKQSLELIRPSIKIHTAL